MEIVVLLKKSKFMKEWIDYNQIPSATNFNELEIIKDEEKLNFICWKHVEPVVYVST